ncbi:trans-sulfuration enzyme family protein [Nakamurella endophytica]|uniref:Cystathionine gamma-synthase n=1 Tax=Nakamurella endophytica TaxID=1748367 RepID=A0A917WGK7_9ACTN|nr:PLP-dependent aspartate aminotransferase family protein [Nakamurella endophytica]GGM02421.1 cystathionine gamma-synthase [Nakamurella endophytica]
MSQYARSTVAVAAGRPPAEPGAPVNTPIAASVTFHQGAEQNYLRQSGSDSLRAFQEALGELEGGRALAFSSGMAAIAAVVEGLPAGSTVVVPRMTYSGTSSIHDHQERLGRLEVRRVEISDTAAVLEALRREPAPALLWIETPTNPMVGVADVPALAEAAHAVGATVVVDSTWNSPLLLRPLEHGADVVMHSVTKYLSGHSDLLMGALVTGPDDDERFAAFKLRRDLTGGLPGMLETFLALRGIRTLAVRMERAQANAGVLAQRLAAHPAVERVLYPGLPDDPGHDLVARLHDGPGAMLSFLVAGGAPAADRVCAAVRLVTNATSLGGVETLVERRAQYAVDAANGTPDNLLRLSVGIEDVQDLWADLSRALG